MEQATRLLSKRIWWGLMSGSELRAQIEAIRSTLESQPADRATVDACAEQLHAAGLAVTAALEAEFTTLTSSSEPSAA